MSRSRTLSALVFVFFAVSVPSARGWDDAIDEATSESSNADEAAPETDADTANDFDGGEATREDEFELPGAFLDLKKDGTLPPSSRAQKEDLTRGAADVAATVAADWEPP